MSFKWCIPLEIWSRFLHQKHIFLPKKSPKFGPDSEWKNSQREDAILSPLMIWITMIYAFIGVFIVKVFFYIKNTNFDQKKAQNLWSSPVTWIWKNWQSKCAILSLWKFLLQWYLVLMGFYIAKVGFCIKNTRPEKVRNSRFSPLTWSWMKVFVK